GVGYDVNTALLDKLAAENGGVAEYVEPKEDLEVKVSNFFTKINHPVLTDLALDMGGVETDLIYPREMPDLFRGTQVTLIGRYRIVTPYTSYLAVGPEAAAAVRGGADVRALPMSRPSANAGTGGGFSRDMAAPPPKEAAKATTGETAVRESRRARAQQEAVT